MKKIFAFLFFLIIFLNFKNVGATSYKIVRHDNGVIKIALKDVDDGKAHFFKIKLYDKEVKFFVLKSKDGVIKADLDACDVCFREKKGFTQDGDYLICNNCGKKFHSNIINVKKGGCNPSPLDRTTDKNFIYIPLKSLESKANYF